MSSSTPWPRDGEAVIRSLSSDVVGAHKISAIELLGAPTNLAFTQKQDGLHIKLPSTAPGKCAYVYRIRFEGSKN